MNNYNDFEPQNEEERQRIENYNNLSKRISDKLKKIGVKDRFTVLKALKPSNLSLMNLFLLSLKSEDYEICEAANRLLIERGLEFKSNE